MLALLDRLRIGTERLLAVEGAKPLVQGSAMIRLSREVKIKIQVLTARRKECVICFYHESIVCTTTRELQLPRLAVWFLLPTNKLEQMVWRRRACVAN